MDARPAGPAGPMAPADATDCLRAMVGPKLELVLTRHSKDQMATRELLVGDILHILKYGFVYYEGENSTRPGCYKYKMECTTPNSGTRTVRIVVIPSLREQMIKVVTVMWTDQ